MNNIINRNNLDIEKENIDYFNPGKNSLSYKMNRLSTKKK